MDDPNKVWMRKPWQGSAAALPWCAHLTSSGCRLTPAKPIDNNKIIISIMSDVISFQEKTVSVTVRVIQRFEFVHEKEFMELERKFAELEARRPDFPKGGRRMQPIAGGEWKNTLIWECEFPSLNAAQDFLDFCATDDQHDELFKRQQPFFETVKVEFYRNLEF
jgi:hypothetical protein